MAKKYKNLQELAAAFASGEIDKTKYKLILDNDDSFLAYRGRHASTRPLPCRRWQRFAQGLQAKAIRGAGFRGFYGCVSLLV